MAAFNVTAASSLTESIADIVELIAIVYSIAVFVVVFVKLKILFRSFDIPLKWWFCFFWIKIILVSESVLPETM